MTVHDYTQVDLLMCLYRFLADYFVGVQQGTESLFREFSFVKATPQNRLSLLLNYFITVSNLLVIGETFSTSGNTILLSLSFVLIFLSKLFRKRLELY